MKNILFFFLIITISFELKAQSIHVKKIYGYKQQIFQGKKPSVNQPLKKNKQYKLFLENRNNCSIVITGVWIQTNYYRFKTHLNESPILDLQQPANKQILVPKVSNKVVEIELINIHEPSPSSTAAVGKLLQNNDVVIAYKFKGKTYFATLKKLTELDPFIGM